MFFLFRVEQTLNADGAPVANPNGVTNGQDMKGVPFARARRRPRPTRLVQSICSYEPVVLPAVKNNSEEKKAATEQTPVQIEVTQSTVVSVETEKETSKETEKKIESDGSGDILDQGNGHDGGDAKPNGMFFRYLNFHFIF